MPGWIILRSSMGIALAMFLISKQCDYPFFLPQGYSPILEANIMLVYLLWDWMINASNIAAKEIQWFKIQVFKYL